MESARRLPNPADLPPQKSVDEQSAHVQGRQEVAASGNAFAPQHAGPKPCPSDEGQPPCATFFELLSQATHSVSQLGELLRQKAADCRLSTQECRALWACHRETTTGASQVELAAELELSPAHVSSMVEQLRQRRLIVAERRPPDRRRQFWRLTAEGRDILAPLAKALDAAIRESAPLAQCAANASSASRELAREISTLLESAEAAGLADDSKDKPPHQPGRQPAPSEESSRAA